jgi:SulP family sulfate permease
MTSKDVISGLVTPVVIITSTLSYAALIFSGPLAQGLPVSIGYGLVSAGLMAIVFGAGSGMPFAIAMLWAKRVEHPLVFPALLLGGTLATHGALHAAGHSLAAARGAGWLLDLSSGVALPGLWLLRHIPQIHFGELLWTGGTYVALVAVTAMTLLLSLMAIEAETCLDVDLDRELRLNGFANILVGLCGGMTGTLSVSRTLFNYRTGARGRASGILAGAVCLLMLAFGTKVLGYVPVALLGALLPQLGAEMLDDWLVKGWRTMERADYIQMVVIFLVIVGWNFVAGVAMGIVAACLTFAINTSRLRLVKLGLDRSVYSGRVDRPIEEQEQLVRHGHSIQIMWLQGFVFFGSAHRLLQQIQEMVAVGRGSCRSLILDFRLVLGIDSSAVMSLIKLRQLADRESFDLVLAEVPPPAAHALRAGGLLGDGDNLTCRVFTKTDGALEWCEDKLLAEIITREEALTTADKWLATEIGGEQMFARLASYLELIECKPGDMLIRQGDAADSLYLLYTGRVTVLLRTAEGVDLRLRSMVGHTIVGEMGVYRILPRGASVRADQPTIAYRLSLEAMTRMEQDDPTLAYAFHKLVIRTLAARLDFANREVASLQR